MKIPMKKALMLSHSLYQRGNRGSNTVYYESGVLYLLNEERTLISRFEIVDFKEKSFSFFISDYDADKIEDDGDFVKFIQENSQYRREKSCRKPELTFKACDDIFTSLWKETGKNKLSLNDSIRSLIDESLSHIEIHSDNGNPIICQRDIYTGSFIKITPSSKGFFNTSGKLKDFERVAMKTDDFLGMLLFDQNVQFLFYDEEYTQAWSNHFKAIVGNCVYDELGTLETIGG